MSADDELRDLISQIIGDYNTHKDMGYDEEKAVQKTIEYDLPNLKKLLTNSRRIQWREEQISQPQDTRPEKEAA